MTYDMRTGRYHASHKMAARSILSLYKRQLREHRKLWNWMRDQCAGAIGYMILY